MKSNIYLFLFSLIFFVSSCEKEPNVWSVENNTDEDLTVFVDYEKTIIDGYETITGEFDADECVDIEVWNGYATPSTATLVKSKYLCSTSTISIDHYDIANPIGGSGGGTGGGSNNLGNATFWTENDLQCGNITVNLTGYVSKTITSYYSNGLSYCDASGCANYYVPAGTYSYTASCTGYNWSGTIYVTEDACYRLKLTL